jgi:hypothetical protein
MGRMYEEGITGAHYIISRFTEKHFKPMLDEYVSKLLISGRTVPLDKM